jgi:hypothetical protein
MMCTYEDIEGHSRSVIVDCLFYGLTTLASPRLMSETTMEYVSSICPTVLHSWCWNYSCVAALVGYTTGLLYGFTLQVYFRVLYPVLLFGLLLRTTVLIIFVYIYGASCPSSWLSSSNLIYSMLRIITTITVIFITQEVRAAGIY